MALLAAAAMSVSSAAFGASLMSAINDCFPHLVHGIERSGHLFGKWSLTVLAYVVATVTNMKVRYGV